MTCPNCGAPISGEMCRYCGTVFIDWAAINMNEPFYLKFKYMDSLLRGKCVCTSADLSADSETNTLYCDGEPVHVIANTRYSMDIHIEFIEDKNGTAFIKIDEDEVNQKTLKETISKWEDEE